MMDITMMELLKLFFLKVKENEELQEKIELLELENKSLKGEITKKLDRDNLTGLYNRGISEEAYFKTKTVIMCDIDDFKALNDEYGHNFGDFILVKIAEILKSSVRKSDYPVRWGGEEFVIFVDSDSVEVAKNLAERIRLKIEMLEGLSTADGVEIPFVTMSFGVSTLHFSDDLKDDIAHVDDALYNSKKNGKNKVTVYDDKKSILVKKK